MQHLDFDRVTAGLVTKSDKIRALARCGAKTADIARYLGIRYQHARNVLARAGMHRASDTAEAASPTGAADGWLVLDALGRVQLTGPMLDAAGLSPGDPVHVRSAEDRLEILSRRGALRRAQAIARKFVPPGVSVVDEFIAERHREAEQENG